MGFRIIAPKRIRKVKTKNGQEVLRRLEEYLESDAVTGEPVEILCGFWEDQQNAITYQELRQAVIDGAISQETIQLWTQDYSVLVANRLSNLWTDAITAGSAGQPILDGLAFEFNTQSPGILNWLSERGAEFVTVCTQEQKDAIAALVTKKMRDGHTVDELSRLIRPCIGLTEGDAKAATRFYDNIVATLKKEHPRMKPESIRKKALDATQKYAERKHRQRAMTIAQTESAFAYNRGADEGIRQAQAEGYLGIMKKRWSTSGDDGVCKICASLEGTEVDMDAEFGFKGRVLFKGHKLLPPAHPRCACAVEYIEVNPPVFAPEVTNPFEGQKLEPELYEQAAENMRSTSSRWRKVEVTDERVVEMVDSVRTYTEADYANILAAQNDFGGRFAGYASTMSEEDKRKAIEDAKNIEEFLSKSPKYKDGVYRGLGFDVGGPYDTGQYNNFRDTYKVGEIVETDTLTSWTKDQDVLKQIHSARTFIDDEAEYSAEVTIRMKNSVSGVDISDYAELEGQKEILFGKNTSIYVKNITENWKSDELLQVIIDVEEL